MSATVNDRIIEFINKHNLTDSDELREDIADFVSGCWKDHFKLCLDVTVPEEKSKKVTKSEKIEDPSDCKERDDLRNCTSGTLNEFCKTHGLRVGGNKKEVMDRVWRHLQGNNSEEDMSPRNKPKKEKKENFKHDCYGCTSKGTPCAVAATVEVNGHWFCWRHEESAAEIIENKTEKVSPKRSEVVAKEKSVVDKKKKSVDPKKQKGKKPVIEEPVESEQSNVSDHEELETDEE